MTEQDQKQLGKTLWAIADQLRGAMNADDFRDYMLAFLFLRYLSDNYEQAAKKELGRDYPDPNAIGNGGRSSLSVWYEQNPDDESAFEKQMRLKAHYVIRPAHLWASIAHMARTQDGELLTTLQDGFMYIENESFQSTFSGLFSEINLGSDKLGKTYADRNAKLCTIITKIAEGLAEFSTDSDTLGDAYEYLIGQFAAGSGKKAGEFYTPQRISDILSAIVALDSQEPKTGKRKHLASVMDFACGSGSLLLNVRKRMGPHGIGKIYGQEKNITEALPDESIGAAVARRCDGVWAPDAPGWLARLAEAADEQPLEIARFIVERVDSLVYYRELAHRALYLLDPSEELDAGRPLGSRARAYLKDRYGYDAQSEAALAAGRAAVSLGYGGPVTGEVVEPAVHWEPHVGAIKAAFGVDGAVRLCASELAQGAFFGPDGAGAREIVQLISALDDELIGWVEWAAWRGALQDVAEGRGGGIRTGTRDRMANLFALVNRGGDAIRAATWPTRWHETERR